MNVEKIDKVIQLWGSESITAEQAIGKILVLLREYERRLLKLEATRPKGNSAPNPD